MHITTMASGSSGNCYLVNDSHSKILLECGVPIRRIQAGAGCGLSGIDGVLCSHEHADHARAAKEIAQSGIPLYATQGTLDALGLSGYCVHPVQYGQKFAVGGYTALPFATRHDSAQPCGFVLRSQATGKTLCFATDTCYVSNTFRGINLYMVEANYLAGTFAESNTLPQLAMRIYKSHMSAESCVEFLKSQDLSQTECVCLLHLSENRADADKIRRMVQRATGIMTVIAAPGQNIKGAEIWDPYI